MSGSGRPPGEPSTGLARRGFLALAAAAALPRLVRAQTQPAETPSAATPPEFGFEQVVRMARDASRQEHQPALVTLSGPFADLSYDRYRAIRFREDRRPMSGADIAFAADLLPPGLVYRQRVDISIVRRSGEVQQVEWTPDSFHFDPAMFGFPDGTPPEGEARDLSYSGFRLRYPLNRPDVLDEFLVFQGASYFRAVARGMIYGISARGLAIGTADARGEEFPAFRRFWIHEPESDAREITVDALLESPSCTGAYRFEISPGETTVMSTRCRIFPRTELTQAGIAPLTSMFFFGPERRAGVDDFRDAVHDSDGLQMITGSGARQWRPLNNPARVQYSAFLDENPKGFGLTQRHRQFGFYQDDEARYDKRPSAWVEPLGAWGRGSVVLVEIPVENEFNDNIVAFWKPEKPLQPTEEGHEFAYRLHWCAEPPDAAPLARVAATRGGLSIHERDKRVYVVDWRKDALAVPQLTPEVWCSAGAVGPVVLRDLPGGETMRASFLFKPGDAELAELTLVLRGPDGTPGSEIWMNRWTAR